jgi:hypothetical protein
MLEEIQVSSKGERSFQSWPIHLINYDVYIKNSCKKRIDVFMLEILLNVKCLPSLCKALGMIPNSGERERERERISSTSSNEKKSGNK